MSQEEPQTYYNWAHTVEVKDVNIYRPDENCNPGEAIEDLQKLIRRNQDKRFRVSQFGHTWQNFFCQPNDYLVCFREYDDPMTTWEMSRNNHVQPEVPLYHDFWGITMVGNSYVGEDGVKHQLFKVGSAAATNDLRKWTLYQWQQSLHNPELKNWQIPANVVMIQNSIGGTVNMMCHGSGVHSKSIADPVVAFEFINAKGEMQRVCDVDLIKQAGLESEWGGVTAPMNQRDTLKKVVGNFGLIGIVTYYYLQFDELQFSEYNPVEMNAEDAIPKNINEDNHKTFVGGIKNSYYNEYFLFPGLTIPIVGGKKKCLVNNWKAITQQEVIDTKKKPRGYFATYQDEVNQLAEQQAIGSLATKLKDMMDVMENEYHLKYTREIFNNLIGSLSLGALKPKENGKPLPLPLVVPAGDALHPARGIQLIKVFDFEVEIPIPVKNHSSSDWAERYDWQVVYDAWWASYKLIYEAHWFADGVGNLPVIQEMRIYGGSDVCMSSVLGNELTFAVEILAFKDFVQDKGTGKLKDDPRLLELWNKLANDCFNSWLNVKDSQGNPLKIRPHWAKQWEKITLDNYDSIFDYIKEQYRDQVPKFKQALTEVAGSGGYSFSDMVARFGNNMIKKIIDM